jgi:hypothetical protein
MSRRAFYCAGLYWHIMLNKLKTGGLKEHHDRLASMAPPALRIVRGLLADVGTPSDKWIKAFEAEGENLRGFTPTIGVASETDDGRSEIVTVSQQWLALHTNILDWFPATLGPDGKCIVKIDGRIGDYMRESGDCGSHVRKALLPNSAPFYIDLSKSTSDPVRQFLEAVRNAERFLPVRHGNREKFKAASNLVRYCGLVPYADDDHEVALARSMQEIL